MADSIRKAVTRRISRALHEFNMIRPGDRVLLGLSGGKDSTTLLHELSVRKKHFDIPFELKAIHIQSEFSPPEIVPFLESQCRALEIDFEVLPVAVLGRLKPGRRMNCYWCSTQRRTELLDYALKNQFTTIALGHHLDDTLETVMMNWMQEGALNGMSPFITYDNYPLRLIRPLVYIEERELVEYIADLQLSKFTCTCDYGQNSERKRMRTLIQQLTGGNQKLKMNMLRAILDSDPANPKPQTDPL